MTVRTYTTAEKRQEALREIAMRKRVYPRWVEAGRMKQEHADHNIAVMEAIAEDYKEPELFK